MEHKRQHSSTTSPLCSIAPAGDHDENCLSRLGYNCDCDWPLVGTEIIIKERPYGAGAILKRRSTANVQQAIDADTEVCFNQVREY